MRTRLAVAAVVGGLLAIAAMLAPVASAESSPSAFADRLVTLINQARTENGLHALTVTSGTSTVAATWTQHLDGAQALSHNPDLGPQLETHGSPNWTAYGENVGDGPTSSADTLFQAYMNSPEHRDNILNSHYRYVGIGVVFDGDQAWNTLDFVDQYSASSTTSTSTTSTSSSPATTTTSSRPRTAPRTTTQHAAVATKPASHPAVHRAAPVSRPRPVVHRAPPAPRPAKVQAMATAAPVAPVAQPTAVPVAEPVHQVAVALPLPVHVPGKGRGTAPFVAAAAAILLVVATRFAVEVLPRHA